LTIAKNTSVDVD